MYTQMVLLLFALRSISAYTLLQVQDQISTRNPQERLTVASGYLRPFTNSHAGYQFPNWELDSLEHGEPRVDDKVIDKIITNSDSSNDDSDYHTDEHDEIDKLDDICQSKEPKNQMFDEIKEKYQKHYPHRFIKRIEAEPTETDRRRRQSNYYQTVASNPVLRDEYGNILHDNVNAIFSGGHLANVPRAYGMNPRNDHGYSYNNHINSMTNEPIYNPYTQTIQERPVEIQTVNNYAYKTVQQSPQEVEPINVMPIYKQPTNEAMYNQLITQTLQQKQVETQTLNTYKPVQQSLQEIALTNSKPMYSKPTNNEAMYNQLISQQVQQKAVDTQTFYKPIPQSPQEVDLTNGQSMYRQPTNEAIFNQYISQSGQQKPVETKTVNNNPYKTEQQSLQEAKLTNESMLPIPEKTKTDNTNKLHQAPHEVPKQNTNKNITEIFEKETTRNNVDVNRNIRNNEDMKNNVKQMSKKIGSIKEKVKDRLASANLSGIYTSPGGRKLLQSYGIIPTGKEDNSKNISARIIEVIEPDPDHVIIEEKSEDENNTIATKDISNINNTIVEVFTVTDLLTKEQIENLVNNSVILNTENQNNNDYALNETHVENESLSIEMLNTTKTSTAPEETKSTEEYIEPRLSAETFNNETAINETEEQTYTYSTGEIESAGTDVTAHDGNEKNSENKEKYEPEIGDVKNSEILNLDKLFDRDEFWEWLSNWTTTYMEIINEKIEALVKVEVAKQMEDLYLVRKTELVQS